MPQAFCLLVRAASLSFLEDLGFMTTIKGEYYVLSEILKGTAINDTFEIGSGSEYVFGYYGSDIAVYPGKINKVKSALYYRGLGFAVIVVEGTLNILDTYFLSGIEILQAIDARIDLTLIDQTGILEYGINPNNAIENYSGRTLFAKNENQNAFFPNLSKISYGDPFRIYGGTSVDLLFVDYSSKWVTISDGQEIDEINIRVNGVDQHRMIAEDIDLIVTIDKAYYKSQDKIWREWNDKINLIESVSQSYTLAPSTSSINEGSTLTTTVTTTNVTSGTTLYYSLSGIGITVADFSSGSLAGSGIVASNGSFSFSHTFSNDLTTEGSETLNIKLFSDLSRSIQVGSTASVAIADTSLALTYYNPITNKTLNTWNAYQVTNSVKAGDIVSQWFGTATPTIQQTQDIIDTKLMDVAATWTDKVQINRVVKASDTGGKIEAKQIDFAAGEVAGSVISGGKGNDDIKGYAGWDNLEGGDGNDLIHGGNGRDIISGGAGRDELHGDFGWNTYRSEKDGASDLIAVKSDHYLVNWLYGKAGNSPNGEKSDIIEGLDPVDKIKIIGVDTSEITFAANISAKGVTGIGIYGKGILEALYTGGDLTVAQITQMTSGDASAAAMSNSVNSYGIW